MVIVAASRSLPRHGDAPGRRCNSAKVEIRSLPRHGDVSFGKAVRVRESEFDPQAWGCPDLNYELAVINLVRSPSMGMPRFMNCLCRA